MHRLGIDEVLDGLTSMLTVIIIIAALYIIAQLIVFSVLVFKCLKFKRDTVKENFLGMKKLAAAAEIFVFLDIINVALSILDITYIIDDWGTEAFVPSLLSWIFPVILLIYGIYAWRCYLRAKKVNLHMMFSGLPSSKKKDSFIDDGSDLFGDAKVIDLNPKKTEEDKESMDEVGNRKYIQSADIDLRKLKPQSSGELVPCPFCESLNAYKSRICVSCGAELPRTENIEITSVSSNDVDVVEGRNSGGRR